MASLQLSRRRLLAGGALGVAAWVSGFAIGHRPLARLTSPFLGSGPKCTLTAVFEALLPMADALELADDVDSFLAAGDPIIGGQLRLALQVLEHLGGAGPLSFRRFSRLSVEDRVAVLDSWCHSSIALKRQIHQALHKTAVFTWYTHPRAWTAIGYDGPWVRS